MPDRFVQVLPDFLINQIAAGEVVENPASVVKELVENSIDAGARRVAVEIEAGGLGLVRVIDDGCGMSPQDALAAMGRHATSKIRSMEDLMSIATLGFRGEALPSIASVSRFTMRTRLSGDDAGTQVEAVDGQVVSRPCACPVGTCIEVRDLFYNVPARLKFQKAESARSMAVADTVRKAALSNPALHFVHRSGTRTVLDFPACQSLRDRASMVLGAQGGMYPFARQTGDAAVEGVLSAPDAARGDASRTVILVNGRPVVDVAIRRVVVGAYSSLLPAGRFPVAVVAITLAPSEVDVNVHPQKHEVRFRRPREVQALLYEAMVAVIESTPWIAPGQAAHASGGSESFREWPPVFAARPESFGPRDGIAGTPDQAVLPIPGLAPEGRSAPRYLGQIGNTVLVCEQAGNLVLIDQHAAHERVNFNHLWNLLEAGEVPSDVLVFPEIVRLDAADMERFDVALAALHRLGFDLEPYSGDSVAVRAVPAILKGRSVAEIVRQGVHAASEGPAVAGDALLRKIVSTVACHASVRAGDPLSPPEAAALLASMADQALSSYCPHGRQAVVVTPLAELLKQFDR